MEEFDEVRVYRNGDIVEKHIVFFDAISAYHATLCSEEAVTIVSMYPKDMRLTKLSELSKVVDKLYDGLQNDCFRHSVLMAISSQNDKFNKKLIKYETEIYNSAFDRACRLKNKVQSMLLNL